MDAPDGNDSSASEETPDEAPPKKGREDWPIPRRTLDRKAKHNNTAKRKVPDDPLESEGEKGGEEDETATPKPKRKRFRTNDFPDTVVVWNGQIAAVNDLASFSSVLRSCGRHEEVRPGSDVHSVEALLHASSGGIPLHRDRLCKLPRESEEMVVAGVHVDAGGRLGVSRGVVVLLAPVTTDFSSSNDDVQWRKLFNTKPVQMTGEETCAEDELLVRAAAETKMMELLQEGMSTDCEGSVKAGEHAKEREPMKKDTDNGTKQQMNNSGRSFPDDTHHC